MSAARWISCGTQFGVLHAPGDSCVGLTKETASAGGFSEQVVVVETAFKANSMSCPPPPQ